jgi:dTMP kinase
MAAARLDHIERLIEPSLSAGKWVLSDRFVDSTIVYQGIAGGVGVERVEALHRLFLSAASPELTLLLDLPARFGLERRQAAGGASRFEAKGVAYHEQVRAGFLEIARNAPERIVVVDGSAPPEIVAGRVAAIVLERFAERLRSVAT